MTGNDGQKKKMKKKTSASFALVVALLSFLAVAASLISCAHASERVLLRELRVVTLQRGGVTRGRRSAGVPQLTCVGGTAKSHDSYWCVLPLVYRLRSEVGGEEEECLEFPFHLGRRRVMSLLQCGGEGGKMWGRKTWFEAWAKVSHPPKGEQKMQRKRNVSECESLGFGCPPVNAD